MDIRQLTSRDLRRIAALIEDREKLQAKLDQLNAELASFGESSPAGKTKSPPRARRRATNKVTRNGGNPRGALQERIVAELMSAGGKGLHIKELSSKLGVKVPNLRVWFLTTGKKNRSIKKVAKATFAWKS